MKYAIISFYEKLSRVFAYLPVLWKIYDFDHSSALEVFKFQLTRIHKSMENGHECEKSLKVKLRKLKILIECCDRLNNDFDEQAWDDFVKKHPERFGDILKDFNKPVTPAYKRDLKELRKFEKARKDMYNQLFIKIFQHNFETFWE
jgi:translation initiation factor 2 alpha subunit (eIF-2alpha)